MTTRLTRAEKNKIIINEAKGIQHPSYYVHTTKSGAIQVRKRTGSAIESSERQTGETLETSKSQSTSLPSEKVESKPQIDYESVTNKQLLEKMLQILESNVVSRDKNLNSVENERVTAENEKFITEVEHVAESRPARRGRTL